MINGIYSPYASIAYTSPYSSMQRAADATQLAQGNMVRPSQSDTQVSDGQPRDSATGIDTERTQGAPKDEAVGKECQTCKNRKYQDQSADPGVSFKSPTQVSPESAPAAVAGHEQQHITRERVQAEQEGREVVSQSVSIKMAVCPECGRVYVAGGEAKTTTRTETSPYDQNGLSNGDAELGRFMDMRA